MVRQRPVPRVGAVTTSSVDGPVTQRRSAQLLRWPAEADRRGPADQPCLWLLPPGELPPLPKAGEDWIRMPADERDVAVRLRQLADQPSGMVGHLDLHIDDAG